MLHIVDSIPFLWGVTRQRGLEGIGDFTVGTINTRTTLIADDLVLLSKTKEGLLSMMNRIDDVARTYIETRSVAD